MRYDEELCKDAVSNLLNKNGITTQWEDGPDPPDYFVQINNVQYALEVTSIHGITKLENKKFTWTQLSNELQNIGQEICLEVESKVDVVGSYFLSLPPLPSLKDQKDKIIKASLYYFNQISSNSKAVSKSSILKIMNKDVEIWKIKDSGNAIIPQALPGGALITRKEEQLSELLEKATNSKIKKLKMFNYPKILVILDRYGFERSKDLWRKNLSDKSNNFFHTIIRVQNNEAQYISGKIFNS